MGSRYPVKPAPVRGVLWRMLGYEPWPGQREFHDAADPRHRGVPRRYRLLCAGARYGKSRAGGMAALEYLLTPGARTWCVGPTYELAAKEFRYTLDGLYRLKSEGVPLPPMRVVDNLAAGAMRVELDFSEGGGESRLKSQVVAKSWKEPESLLGEEVDLLVLCEGSQCNRMIWERYLRPRLGTRLGRVVLPTTPRGLDDFLYPVFYKPAMEGHPDYWCGQYGVWDNPLFDRKEVEDARASLDANVFAEQYGGQFVSFVGRVYKDFERRTHVVEPFAIPPDWPRWRTIDYGYEDPFACLWVAADADGRLYVYKEHYVKRQILSWHVERILKMTEGEVVDYTVVDPAALGKRIESGASLMTHMAEMGLPGIKGNNDLEAGIFRMMEWLKVDPVSGKPGLVVFENCVNTVEEFEQYRWKEQKDGKAAHVVPEDRHNHACDALRYLTMSRPRRYVEAKMEAPRHSFRRYRDIARRIARQERSDVIGGNDILSRPGW